MVTTTADLTVIPTDGGVIVTYWTEDLDQERRTFSTLKIREWTASGSDLNNVPVVVSRCVLAYLLINAEDDSFIVDIRPMYRENGNRVEFS